MTIIIPDGWGGGRWGTAPWGGAEADDLQLRSALAVRENVVRLEFNFPVFFDGLLTPFDGSNRRRYSVTAVEETLGSDGLPARTVFVVLAEVPAVEGSLGKLVDVFIDRPFSPFPAEYVIAVNNLIASGSSLPLDPNFTSLRFFGVQRARVPDVPEAAVPSRDISNPFGFTG